MKIVAGELKGLKLEYFLNKQTTRPMMHRVREYIENSIDFSSYNYGLDMFAGTGAIGLEAISAGLSFCDFCEFDTETFIVLKKNCEQASIRLDNNHRIKYFRDNSYNYIKKKSQEYLYDLIIVAPPYNTIANSVFEDIYAVTTNDALIILELEKDEEIEIENFKEVKSKSIGKAKVIFLKKNV